MSLPITVDDITAQIKLVRDIREFKAQASIPVKEANAEQDQAEARLIELLNDSGLKTLKTEFGKATVVQKSSVKIPETPEDMMRFLDYVKEHDPDLYRTKVCMKSTDINAYYEMKLEEAKASGADDLEIPGVGAISFRETLSFTKA